METICMKYQSLFSGKIKKSIVSLSPVEIAQSVVKVLKLEEMHNN